MKIRGLAAFLVVGLLAACAAPNYTYVKNSDEHTYFKVPRRWHKVDHASLDEALNPEDADSAAATIRQRLLLWSVAYDGDDQSSPAHLFSAQTDEPFVYASVRRLTDAERDKLSLDRMRDAVLPVTENARQAAAAAGVPLDGFELLADEVVKPHDGIRGLHIVFNYRVAGGPDLDTFDQTAYTNNATDRMYLMVIRCSTRCYRERGQELGEVATSFTVRSAQ